MLLQEAGGSTHLKAYTGSRMSELQMCLLLPLLEAFDFMWGFVPCLETPVADFTPHWRVGTLLNCSVLPLTIMKTRAKAHESLKTNRLLWGFCRGSGSFPWSLNLRDVWHHSSPVVVWNLRDTSNSPGAHGYVSPQVNCWSYWLMSPSWSSLDVLLDSCLLAGLRSFQFSSFAQIQVSINYFFVGTKYNFKYICTFISVRVYNFCFILKCVRKPI